MRGSEWSLPIDKGFTGQVIEQGMGLHDYGARHYAQPLGRWIAPDTIVPDPANPQSLNRYSYTLGNPVRYIDPTGHQACLAWAPIPYIALPCQVVEQIALHGPEIVNLIQQITISAPEIPAVVDQFTNPGHTSSSASNSASSQFDPSKFNFDPGNFDPNKNRPQDVGQEAHRQFREEFREQMAEQGREEGIGDYLTEKAIRDAQGNVVRNAQGNYGKPDAIDYVNHIIYDLKPWQEGGIEKIRNFYSSQFDLYIQLYEQAYGVTPIIEIVPYGVP